jgi:hypothetical protein
MIVTPDMLHSPLTRDLIMPIQQPGPDPKTGKGDTHYENMTITAGTPTATALQLISAAFAQKNERDLKEEQLKIQKETAGSEAGLRTAQSASAYAEAAERRSQVLLNDAKAAATASGGEVDWGPGGDKGFNSWHDKNVTPALMKETNYRLSSNLYNEYQALRKQGKDFPAGSQSVQMLANHLQGTFGNVKGARIGKDLIEQHLGARSVSDSALVAVQKLTSGDKLSPAQWDAFFSMIGQTRDESWRSVLDDAQALGRPLDYIAFPSDLRQRWGLGPGRMGQPLGGAAAPAAAPAGGVAVTAPDGKIYQFADQQSADSFKQKAGIK